MVSGFFGLIFGLEILRIWFRDFWLDILGSGLAKWFP